MARQPLPTVTRRAFLAAPLSVALLAACGTRIPCDQPNVDQRECVRANATIAAVEKDVDAAVERAARQAVDAAAAQARDEASRQAAGWWDGLTGGVRGVAGGQRETSPPAPLRPAPVPKVAAVPASARVASVPFVPQIWSNNTVVPGKPERDTTGLNNCGPASVAMAIGKYRGKDAVTLDQVAYEMRGKPNSNVAGANSETNFRDPRTVKYLADAHRLSLRDVKDLAALRAEVAADRPVIVLIDNKADGYVRRENGQRVPYSGDGNGWFQSHIVVVVGYDEANVYVNDPLGWPPGAGERFRVANAAFEAAANAKRDHSGAWYASAVVPAG